MAAGTVDDLDDAQAAALRTLRARLQEKPPVEGADLALWGVPLDGVSEATGTKKQNVVLLKFLRAREFRVEEAFEALSATLQWRKAFNVAALATETFPASFGPLGGVAGRDRGGRPITWSYYETMDVEQIFGKEGDLTSFIRWRVQLMERAVAQLDFETGIETVFQVHDYHGVSFFSVNANVRRASKVIVELFQAHYPEFLQTKLFLNVPAMLEWVYAAMTMFSNKRTTSKFNMVATDSVRSTLLEHISPTELPVRYGGFVPRENAPAPTTVTVDSGRSLTVDVALPSHHSAYVEWMAERNDVAVTVERVEAPKEGEAKMEEAKKEEAKKELAKKEAAKLEIKAERAETGKIDVAAGERDAVIKITFDNSFSFFTSKRIIYRVTTTTTLPLPLSE